MDGEMEIQKAYEAILQHDFEKAIEWFAKAIAAEPDNAAYHHKLSITYARSNKVAKAIEHAKIAIQLDGDNESYRFHLQTLRARELMEQAEKQVGDSREQSRKAISLLQEAIALDPLAVEAYLILGEAQASICNYEQALEAVHEALRLEPDHDIARRQAEEYRRHIHQSSE